MQRNLVVLDRAERRGVGCQAPVARRSEWPGPPQSSREDTDRVPRRLLGNRGRQAAEPGS